MSETDAGSNDERQPPTRALIESLPNEVLVALLSAAHSTTDLHALIRASPALYRVFLWAKRAVLLSIVSADLGSALRDAVAVCLMPPAVRPDLEDCEGIIQKYEALPRGDGGMASARGLSTDVAVKLVQANRSAQYLIDEYEASRLPELREVHPDAAGPMTTTERRRLAAALFRHQVLARIGRGYSHAYQVALLDKFFALFRPWELHQLADAHWFLDDMRSRACSSDRRPREPPTSLARRTNWELSQEGALFDLGCLHSEVVAERAHMAADLGGPVTPASAPWGVDQRDGMRFKGCFNFLISGPLPVKGANFHVAREHRGLRDELYRREDAMPPLVPGDDDEGAPPFAWIDAHGGLNCQRWGYHVRREVLPQGQNDLMSGQFLCMQHNLGLWRWLGFAFWDRGRVELLKTGMPEWETGWLTVAPPSSAECKRFYGKVRRPRMVHRLHLADGTTNDFDLGYNPEVILGVRGTAPRQEPTVSSLP